MIPKKRFLLMFIMVIFLQNLFVHQHVYASSDGNNPSVWELIHEEQNEEGEGALTNTEEPSQETTDTHPLILVAKLIFYTGLVVFMIYACIKFLASRQKRIQHHQVFQQLGGTTLAPNKSLQLVKLGGKMYLLGVGDEITLIKEISDQSEMNEIERNMEEQETIISKGFIDLFLPWLKSNVSNPSQNPKSSFQDVFQQSIQKQKMKRQHVENELHSPASEEEEGRFK